MGAKQVNGKGEIYETKYGLRTSERVYGTVRENQLGNGPCYLRTTGITEEQDDALLKAYLNMAPGQTLKWIESGKNPSSQDVEICGTEPYIVGGHTASGFWVNTKRETTVHGLYAAGDVAGGCPQKYVTGALAEGEIAAEDIIKKIPEDFADFDGDGITAEYERILSLEKGMFSVEELEEAMQKVMDEYAGGISTQYQYNEKQLELAEKQIRFLMQLAEETGAADMHELMYVYELKERLLVARALIAHLRARKETRWHAFQENLDYPKKKDSFFCYVNSVMENGEIRTFTRDIVEEKYYEHKN